MNLVSRLRERRRLRRLRRAMRGYRRLRTLGQLEKLGRVREALSVLPMDGVESGASALFFGAGVESAELVVRQFLLARFGSLEFNKALLSSLGQRDSKVIAPLPAQWRRVVEEHGFRIARLRCALLWNGYLFVYLAFGTLSMLRRGLVAIQATIHPTPLLGRFVHFASLSIGNLPHPGEDGRSYDVVSWYQQWPGRVRNLDTICHDVPAVASPPVDGVQVVTVPAIVQPLSGWGSLARFVGWGIAATTLAVIGLLTGRWWHALLLNEASAAAIVRLQSDQRIAREYLFHNSSWIYRPLWTYEAEKKGSRISFYFYSTNTEAFKQGDQYPPVTYGYAAMNWPHYLVWDEYHAAFVRRAAGAHAHVSTVGPIWFNGSPEQMSSLPPHTVAVFDVQPVRDSHYQMLGLELEYYLPDTSRRFLQDIADAIAAVGAHMAFKRKREIGRLAHPQYRRFVDRFQKRSHIIAIPPDVSANRVIERCAAVISMPFTSTALIGRHLEKPSVYYDPTGLIHRNDRAAHGVEVLSGPDELRAWLASVTANHSIRHENSAGALDHS